ncbi:MAG: hypothetical protein JNK23_05455 [Opitutaceae bacterium]|nr:hypothetical protein [Opitutaceae bacterium]
MIERKDLRDWLFRGLMFEADAEVFRGAGIRVGASQEASERSLVQEALAPFSVDLRNQALRMARLYAMLYCFENSVRGLVRQRLEEKYGPNWWAEQVSSKIVQFAESRQKDALENSWLEGATKDPLGFIQFGHLADIIIARWEDFSDLVPTQHWVKQRMDELEKARNFIAHNRLLMPAEFSRIEMYLDDWNKTVGF